MSSVHTEPRLVAGRYRLLSPLGSGGMGTVWRAEDVLLGREVAVKEVTFPHGVSDEDREVLRERTRREARAAARLDHPSAVTVYDVVEEGGAPYLVMELVEARTLSQVVRSDGPLSQQRTAQVGLALLGALETAHRQGIVHRDVKPGNVLLTEPTEHKAGRVVLTDFGIASSPGDSSITSTGLLLGSPSYIAPERARGQAPAPASDLWSLGATLFTAVEGRPPYDGGEPILTVTAVVTGEHEPFLAAGPLEPIIEGLLERDPTRRLTVAAARAALTPIAERAPAWVPVTTAPVATDGRPFDGHTAALPAAAVRERVGSVTGTLPAPRTEPTWSQEPPAPRRRSRAPLAGLALLLVVGAGLGGFAMSGDPDPGTPSAQPSSTPADVVPVDLPAGWSSYTDPDEGWTVGVPPGYTRSERGAQVQFRDDQARLSLRIDAQDDPSGTAVERWQAFSPQLAGSLADYREVRLEQVEFRGFDAADLEFTYRDSGADLHVLDRLFHDEDGSQSFALYWQGNEADFAASQPLFEQIAATFVPRS